MQIRIHLWNTMPFSQLSMEYLTNAQAKLMKELSVSQVSSNSILQEEVTYVRLFQIKITSEM